MTGSRTASQGWDNDGSSPAAGGGARPDRRPRRNRPLLRSYEAAFLRRDGSVGEVARLAPALPAFEDTVSAFARGTPIATTAGPVAVEDLRPGMEVPTVGAGTQRVIWIGSTALVPDLPDAGAGLARLLRVVADAFGPGRPDQDVMLGPAARLVRGHASLPALDAADGVSAVEVRPARPVRLYHIVLSRHARLIAAGLEVESYHPAPMTEDSLPRELLDLYLSLFPGIGGLAGFGQPGLPRVGPA